MRSPRISVITCSLLIVLLLPTVVFAQTALTPFTLMVNPGGIAVDADGDVYITSDSFDAPIITQFTADGTVVNQSTLSGITVGSQGHLAFDRLNGQIYDLVSSGQVLLIDPETLEDTLLFDIPDMDVDTSAIFDITTGTVQSDLSDVIAPQSADYGDIAVYSSEMDTVDLFLSGVVGGYPFILRIRRFSDGSHTAQVLASTLTPNRLDVTNPPGVGVSDTGTVVTTLPSYPGGEYVVSFHADFPETGTGTPSAHLVGVTSQGIDADTEGNYFVATGLEDIPMCDMKGGAVVMLSADLNQFACSPSGLEIGLTYDLSIHPDRSGLYLSASSGFVWYYDFTS